MRRISATVLAAAITAATAIMTPAAAGDLPAQYTSISGLEPAHNLKGAWTRPRIATFASPAPDAANMHIVETRNGLIIFDTLRRRSHAEEA